jgi:DNA modification methylase
MTKVPIISNGRSVTNAVDSASLSRHRWYPIKEGFSPNLIAECYEEQIASFPKKRQILAIEPFSGSGTTPVECSKLGISCAAFEVNPFLAFVGRTKLRQADPEKLRNQRSIVLRGLSKPRVSPLEKISTFCENPAQDKRLFNKSVLRAFTGGWKSIEDCPPTQRAFFRLALLRAVMDNCNAYPDGKCLRYKRLDSYDCFNAVSLIGQFEQYCGLIEQDLESTPFDSSLCQVECMDSRNLGKYHGVARFDLCVTSPPYLNSFDYSDVYRPELFLAGYVTDNRQLMQIRLKTLRSHVQASWTDPVKTSFGTVYAKVLSDIILRKEVLWSARIPKMIQAYFEDMETLLVALAKKANAGASLKIAVATSAYAGVVVPVDFILAEIAEQAGWELRDVQVVRRLRSSAQLWKHEDHEKKVPELRESLVILRFPEKSSR